MDKDSLSGSTQLIQDNNHFFVSKAFISTTQAHEILNCYKILRIHLMSNISFCPAKKSYLDDNTRTSDCDPRDTE